MNYRKACVEAVLRSGNPQGDYHRPPHSVTSPSPSSWPRIFIRENPSPIDLHPRRRAIDEPPLWCGVSLCFFLFLLLTSHLYGIPDPPRITRITDRRLTHGRYAQWLGQSRTSFFHVLSQDETWWSPVCFRWNSNDDPLSSLSLLMCARCATSRLLCTGDAWTCKVL